MIRNLVGKLSSDEAKVEAKEVALRALLNLCGEDESNAMDFYRVNGLKWLKTSLFGCENEAVVGAGSSELTIKLLIVLCSHKRFVHSAIDTSISVAESGSKTTTDDTPTKLHFVQDVLNRLAHHSNHPDVIYYAVMLTMHIVKYIESPSVESSIPGAISSLVDHLELLAEISECFVAILQHLPVNLSTMYVFQLVMNAITALCSGTPDYIASASSGPGGKVVTDARYETLDQRKQRFKVEEALASRSCCCAAEFVERTDFISAIMNNMSDIFSDPCSGSDSKGAVSKAKAVVSPSPLENYSHSFILCISKVFLAYKKDDALQPLLAKYLTIDDLSLGGDRVANAAIITQCRQKAILQLVLLTSQPTALGSWSVHWDGGESGRDDKDPGPASESESVSADAAAGAGDDDGGATTRNPIVHLLYLISVGSTPTGASSLPNYYYNQYLAAEVICLAASEPTCHAVLAPLISSSILTSLMHHSPFVATRAAAASTLTKLGLKASAIKDASEEVSCYLNTISDILQLNCSTGSSAGKSANSVGAKAKAKGSVTDSKLVSFSTFDNTAVIGNSSSALSSSPSNSAQLTSSSSSLERCIEMLAALSGKTFVKEEIVHGSFRVKACVSHLIELALKIADEYDPKRPSAGSGAESSSTGAGPVSTASNAVIFGIVHSLSLLTVCNKELHMQALAEKDMTYEQYETMQKLQSSQLRQEKAKAMGVEVADLEDDEEAIQDDPDTTELCKRRIVKIVSANGIKAIVRLLGVCLSSASSSGKIRELACRTLRQICVVEGVTRGSMIQQGGLNVCNQVAGTSSAQTATEKASDNLVRREAAHAVAKTLVTTNPISLKDNQRISSIHSLVVLCKDNDANNLQQFEALLALTNLLSTGEAERNFFVKDQGVSAVNYLMFSEHQMVRRAATECMCNMAGEEPLFKLMRLPDKVRLWIGFTGEYSTEDVTPKSFEGANNALKETFLTARAAAGTLAGCCQDIQVASACMQEDIVSMFTKILVDNSRNHNDGGQNIEIIHRVLVAIKVMCVAEYAADAAPIAIEGAKTPLPPLKSHEELHESIITYLISSNILAVINACVTNYAVKSATGVNIGLPPEIIELVREICEVLQYFANLYGSKNR